MLIKNRFIKLGAPRELMKNRNLIMEQQKIESVCIKNKDNIEFKFSPFY